MNKRQCVCGSWSGCGGNSNLFYSYKHCMLICGEFAVGGAGVDERYMNRTYVIRGRPPVSPGTRTHTETTMIWYQPAYPPYSEQGRPMSPQQIIQRPPDRITYTQQQGYQQPQPMQPQTGHPHTHPHPHPHQQGQYPQDQYQQVQYPAGQYQQQQQQEFRQRQQQQWHQSEAPSGQYAEFRSSAAHSSHTSHSSASHAGYQYGTADAPRRSGGYERPRSVQRAYGKRTYR
ncbi:Kunitz/Bovine pancreatic trypsin inhibitor domain protein [Cooperia oncophora]